MISAFDFPKICYSKNMIRYGTALTAQSCTSECSTTGSHSFVKINFFNLFWIFFIASIIGLIAETIVGTFMDGFTKSRAGLIWGPFSPLYGLGALFMTIFLNNLKGRNPFLIFMVAAVVGGLLEYCAGWLLENLVGVVAWSYQDYPLNINGYTCVPMMIVWGIAGVIWVYAGLPIMMKIIGLIPQKWRTLITTIMATFIFVDAAFTIASLDCWYERMAGVPVENPVQVFFNTYYNNEWMQNRFEAMGMWAELAQYR